MDDTIINFIENNKIICKNYCNYNYENKLCKNILQNLGLYEKKKGLKEGQIPEYFNTLVADMNKIIPIIDNNIKWLLPIINEGKQQLQKTCDSIESYIKVYQVSDNINNNISDRILINNLQYSLSAVNNTLLKLADSQTELNNVTPVTGGASKQHILGRDRTVIIKGRSKFITYKGKLMNVTDARKLEKSLKS